MSFFVSVIFIPVIQFLIWGLVVYKWIVVIAVLLTWVNPDPYNPIVRIIYSLTEPAFRVVHRILPLRIGMIDLTPILVFLFIEILIRFMYYILFSLA